MLSPCTVDAPCSHVATTFFTTSYSVMSICINAYVLLMYRELLIQLLLNYFYIESISTYVMFSCHGNNFSFVNTVPNICGDCLEFTPMFKLNQQEISLGQSHNPTPKYNAHFSEHHMKRVYVCMYVTRQLLKKGLLVLYKYRHVCSTPPTVQWWIF